MRLHPLIFKEPKKGKGKSILTLLNYSRLSIGGDHFPQFLLPNHKKIFEMILIVFEPIFCKYMLKIFQWDFLMRKYLSPYTTFLPRKTQDVCEKKRKRRRKHLRLEKMNQFFASKQMKIDLEFTHVCAVHVEIHHQSSCKDKWDGFCGKWSDRKSYPYLSHDFLKAQEIHSWWRSLGAVIIDLTTPRQEFALPRFVQALEFDQSITKKIKRKNKYPSKLEFQAKKLCTDNHPCGLPSSVSCHQPKHMTKGWMIVAPYKVSSVPSNLSSCGYQQPIVPPECHSPMDLKTSYPSGQTPTVGKPAQKSQPSRSLLRGLDFNQINWLKKPRLRSQLCSINDPSCGGNDLPTSSVNGVSMQNHITHFKTDGPHVLFCKCTFFGSPLETSHHRVLDFIQVLNPLHISTTMFGPVVSGPKHHIFLARSLSQPNASNKVLARFLGSSLGPIRPSSMASASPSSIGLASMYRRRFAQHGPARLLQDSLTERNNRIRLNDFCTTHEVLLQVLQTDFKVELSCSSNNVFTRLLNCTYNHRI
ncbi:hypothetical protein RJ641_025778 [Dillenia turbinata]|uniref:Uncharacterized protein n=1 Tax=Dillenia turbinata TaxID=194707 RepID=A0AAN8W9Y7_9MAGN